MTNHFQKDGVNFIVPLKCGFTGFVTAFQRGIISNEVIPSGAPITALIRNPVNRVRSIFQDKLRQHVNRYDVQHCQRVMMDHMGLRRVESLRDVTFDEFLTFLSQPKEPWDAHFEPFTKSFEGYRIARVLNLDDAMHSGEVFRLLQIPPTDHQAYNRSTPYPLTLTPDHQDLIHRLYLEDFKLLYHTNVAGDGKRA